MYKRQEEEEARGRGKGVVEGLVDEEALRECFVEDENEQHVGVAERVEDEDGAAATPERALDQSAMTFFPRPRLDDDGVSTFAPATPRVRRVVV